MEELIAAVRNPIFQGAGLKGAGVVACAGQAKQNLLHRLDFLQDHVLSAAQDSEPTPEVEQRCERGRDVSQGGGAQDAASRRHLSF